MNITTKEFNISEAEFRYLNRITYYKAIKFLVIISAIITLITIISSVFHPRSAYIGVGVWSVIMISLLLAIPFITNVAKSQPKIHFRSRSCEITDNYFTLTFEDGSLTKTNFNDFIKVIRESNYYFLYMGKIYFHYLPIRAFNSEDDINAFEAALRIKKLMK